ncbi:hypothetical protein DSL72_003840 [Monilinia vaccinii-corymbosi]|uniref:Elongator complex protein 5 n=1 Tax=Monilinia vaccinii-corymbosi TaxID=61207 RepID=A0A8A3P2D3_9HELO|nr:hypothetical protein DSL72_003840 [Monilinia vaccinii-corymbosi]
MSPRAPSNFSKLFNLRDGASPFTLVLDSLGQSGRGVVGEFWRRALISKSKVIFISFSTLQKQLLFKPDVFISAHSKPLSQLRREIVAHLPSSPTAPPSTSQQKILLIIDNLHPLASYPNHLSPFLTSLFIHPTISLLCTYHLDIPLPSPTTTTNPYTPTPLTTLLSLATAILEPHNFTHALARKRARDKSAREPEFGIAEGREGVIMGLGNGKTADAKKGEIIITLEIRRRSGRGTRESFVYTPPPPPPAHHTSFSIMTKDLGTIQLLDEHPSFAAPEISDHDSMAKVGGDEGIVGDVTFNLGLTEKQKRDRENVVLPYFDAQKEGGIGSGGKILYEMGAEDREDFDDEEDEI